MALTKLNNRSVSAVTSFLSEVTNSDLPAGTVLQVQSTVLRTSVYGTNTNSVASIGLDVDITPRSASSKILVNIELGSFVSQTTGTWAAGRLYRNGSVIPNALANVCTNNNYSFIDGYNQNNATLTGDYRPSESSSGVTQVSHSVKGKSMTFLDSPNTTSTLTYDFVVFARPNTGATWAVNVDPRNDFTADHVAYAPSTITVMEIAG